VSVDLGTVINDRSNEQLVQGQESFSVAALGGMGQNLEYVQGSEAFRFDILNVSADHLTGNFELNNFDHHIFFSSKL